MLERWRLAVVSVCVGIASAGCSLAGPFASDQRVEVFADLPRTCQELDATAAGGLGLFGAGLTSPATGLTGESRADGETGQSLRCVQTFENPVPASAQVRDGEPMLRSAVVTVMRSAYPPLPWPTTVASVPGYFAVDALGPPTTLPGVGQNAVTWMERDSVGVVSTHTEARIDNLTINVETWGADWSSDLSAVRDSSDLRADLRAGADAIATAMASALPPQLPRTTIGRHESLPTGAKEPSLPSTPKLAAWDPCTLADPVVAAAGLPGAGAGVGEFEFRGCSWATDWGDVEIYSSAVTFDDQVHKVERFANRDLVTFDSRTAIQLTESRSSPQCLLAFDTPFGTRDGRSVGTVRIELTVVHQSKTSQRPCDLLTPIGAALAPHIPPGR